jgi:hypothetical protein
MGVLPAGRLGGRVVQESTFKLGVIHGLVLLRSP